MRAELGPGAADAAIPAAEGDAEERLHAQQGQLEQLRAHLGRAEAERDKARAAHQRAPAQ